MENQSLIKVARRLGPWLGIPLGTLVLIDYAKILMALTQVAIGLWLSLLVLGFFAGMALSLALKLNEESKWRPLLKVNLLRVLPSVSWGIEISDWLMKESTPLAKPEAPKDQAPADEPLIKHSQRLDRRD